MKKSFHEIWHGDSRKLVTRFKPGRIDCLITDPPFGVNNKSNHAVTEEGKSYARKIAGDETPAEALQLFTDVWCAIEYALAPTADVYIFTSYQVLELWLGHLDALLGMNGYKRKALLVWDKGDPGIGDLNSPWGMGMEFIMFYQRGRERTVPRANSIIHHPRMFPGSLIHPHEKPLGVLSRLIKASAKPGDFLVDPFAGSGSLVRAAKACGCNAVGIESDLKNYQIAKRALQDQGDSLF